MGEDVICESWGSSGCGSIASTKGSEARLTQCEIQRRTSPGLGGDLDILDLEVEKPCPRIKIVKQGEPDQAQLEPLQPGLEMRDECVAVGLGRPDTDMKSSAYELLERMACESLVLLLTVTHRPRRTKNAMQLQPADFHSRRSIKRMLSRTRMPESAKLLDNCLIMTCCEMRWVG